MQIASKGKETFLYLNGIEVPRTLRLGTSIELIPTECDPDPDAIIKVSKDEVSLGVAAIFLRQVRSQIRITHDDPKSLGILAWNTLWDAIILSAVFDCDAVCNFQCDKPAEKFGVGCDFEITNYHFRGLSNPLRKLSEEESLWFESNFEKAKRLIEIPEFQNAIHSLATYRWHSHPRARLALLWSGIEGLFRIESEVVFRLSLYVARFLYPENESERKSQFLSVKKLYKQRSAAVHGSKVKGDINTSVDSTKLLTCLVHKCIVSGELPRVEEFAP